MSDAAILLDGGTLSIAGLEAAARGAQVAIAPGGLDRMRASRAVIERAVSEKRAIYGVTTGLGARVSETLDGATLAAFSLQTLRGRAQAVGQPETVAAVRAGMIVRLNTLLSGHSGASVAVADHLLACLNAGLTPVTGRIGSIGPSDLVVNATVGLALTGEGRMHGPDGVGDAAAVMRRHGIAPLQPGPRDGLALAGHCGPSAGGAALALAATARLFRAGQSAAALSLEGFRANLAPLDPRALAAKPLPGQAGAVQDLCRRLEGSRLWQAGQARRLQDPLSLRHIAQIHGALWLAMEQAERIALIEINGASDNPVVDPATGDVVPTGAYYSAELALVCETVTRATLGAAMALVARIARLLDPRTGDLPPFLARDAATSNGFAPLMKTAEALVAEIAHAAQPPAIWPSLNALGVEDTMSTTPVAVRALERAVDHMALLVCLEFIVAAQAVDLRGCAPDLGPFLGRCHDRVRGICPPLDDDRSLSAEIELLAGAIRDGTFDL
ncbi:MAG: aromatic amino acid ammonia-lyase [Proteobacteria bacterium]|nr:aromatic amino acid ammonia-lyase [Pseudomonadota bacterium]